MTSKILELRRKVSGSFNNEDSLSYVRTNWAGIDGKPSVFSPAGHMHDASHITSGTISNSVLPSTLSGLKTFNDGIIIPGQNNYIELGKKDNWFWTRFSGENWTVNNTYMGSGWARNLMEMKDAEGDAYFRIGAQGSGQNFTQMYIGPGYNNYWLSLNNTRALFRARPQYASNPTTNDDLTRKLYVDSKLDNKVDKVSGKGLSDTNFTQTEKTKLDGIEAGAEVNTVLSVAGKTGDVLLNKGDVGLANVDNTADLSKPISTATQAALDLKANDNEVVKLSGTQTIEGVKTFQTNLLKLYSDGQNGDMTIRLGDRDSTYGFELEYLGSGSGNNNDLILRADDQIGPSKEVFRIKQDAKLDFKTSPTINGKAVILEGDSRLTNARPASDVKDWAKAANKPTYTWSDIGSKPSWIGSSKPSYNASEIGGLGASYRWLTDTYISQWNAKQNALGFTPENTANKRTSIRTSGANHTSYVSELGVKTYVDGQIGSVYRPAGDWNANTNLPALANNTPANSGKVYRVSTAGTRFGFTFAVGDKLAFNEDGVISKWDNVDDVVSVNGQAGTVVLTTDDIDEGSNLYVSQSEKNTWNGKQSAITGAATTITSSNLVSSRALISGSTGKVVVSEVTSTELNYLDGVTSNIQTQLNGKAASSHMHEIANVIGLQSALNGKVDKVSGKGLSTNDFTTTEKNKLSGIQAGAQVNAVTTVAGRTGVVVLAKADVGLGSVQNYSIASKTQAESGTSNYLYMTPLRTKELITVVMGDIESALDAILGV